MPDIPEAKVAELQSKGLLKKASEVEGDYYYKVWWQEGGYKHFELFKDAVNAEHPKKGRPVRIDRIEIVKYYPERESGL